MMKKRLLTFYVFLVLVTSIFPFLMGCNDSDCTTSNTAYVHYGIYDQNGQMAVFKTPVTVKAVGTDSVLINQESDLKFMQLPLSYTHVEDTFVVSLSETLFDTIFVAHENIPHFISMDCGTGMYHRLLEVRCVNRIFDSIKIVYPDITYDAKEHIKIYCTVVD